MKLSRIDAIDPSDASSWSDCLFLTIDLDWCADPVLEYTLDRLEAAGAHATLFVTHDTPLLGRMRANPRFEIGIHPNFNPLLAGDGSAGATAAEVVQRCMAWVPEARSVRSHALVQSTYLLREFELAGLRYDCNTFVGHETGIELAPIPHFCGQLVRVPHLFEDDIELARGPAWDAQAVLGAPGLRVLDFHPIHLFLNTDSLDRYETSRPAHRDIDALRGHVNDSTPGTRTFFDAVLSGVTL